MPELPEVETVRLGLLECLIEKEISSVNFDWPKSFRVVTLQKDDLISQKVLRIDRRGKALIIKLSSGNYLLIHLRMTGQLVYRSEDYNFGAGHPNESLAGSLPDKSTRVIIEFIDGSKLFFNDQRKFGFIKYLTPDELAADSFLKNLGPEPLEQSFLDFKISKKGNIKAYLLDQKNIAGIGNIYADESLFMAGIHPKSRLEAVPEEKLSILIKAIPEVLNVSIGMGGSTDKNYVDAYGRKGSFLKFAKVFRRQKQECYDCGNVIVKYKSVAGRGTHACEYCQVLYE